MSSPAEAGHYCCSARGVRLQADQNNPVKRLSLSESRPRVKPIVDGPQPRLEHVRVNLRGRKVRMPEHHLDRPQIGAAFEQVRGKRVTDHVRTEGTRQVGAAAVSLEELPEPDAAHRLAANVQKQ